MGKMDSRTYILGSKPSYVTQILQELRDREIQQDRMRFRSNLEKLGELLAYEISRSLSYLPAEVQTPLGFLEVPVLESQPVVVSVLRAGLPMHQGILRLFDRADNGFVSAYRHYMKGSHEFEVRVEYLSLPDISGRDLILADPMIATGRSLHLSYQAIREAGEPARVFIAGAIASEEGLAYLQRNIPHAHFYLAALDRELTAEAYIVPGLGDAGDLAFGPK
jgi:uracil phosphoribosyltransferase